MYYYAYLHMHRVMFVAVEVYAELAVDTLVIVAG